MIANIYNNTLTIGPDYKDHRGGMGAVLEVYSVLFQPFHFIPTFRPFKYKHTKIIFFLKQVYRVIVFLHKNKNIQLVHIHGASKGSFYRKFFIFLIAKKIFHKKIIYHIHAGKYDIFYKNASWLTKKWVKYFFRNVDLVICLSDYWKSFFEQQFKCRRITIINNPILKPIYKANANIVDPIRLLFLGRINKDKGVFDLMQAIQENKIKYRNKIKLYIGGEGESKKLLTYIDQEKLNNIVEYIGWVDNEKKNEIFSQSHIYILPSYYEGLPMSILEAMSYGMPIISTNVGGIPEIVKQDYNGWIIDAGNLKALQKAIDFFIDYPDKIKNYGENSLKLVESYISERVLEQLKECYSSILTFK